MASGPNMMAPICLVENNNEQLSVNQKAIEILGKISQPVVVVAIVGLYRTGKSYLMNRLAGQNHGFPLGSTVQSETKGIWMWCVPHPSKLNHTLVLLDTEGLGDVEKGDPKNDSWIFALAVLLCSSFVYNSMSTINHQALEQLHYVTELTELIRAKSSPRPDEVQDSTEFVSFFPDFIWTVRDFTLELKLDGHPITEDEYLENALKLIPGIRGWAGQLINVSENELDSKFQEQINKFCSYIFTHARPKTLREGIMVTGNRLRTLVVTYVDTINTGAVPCLENAVRTLAQLENSVAMQKAADHYSEQMLDQSFSQILWNFISSVPFFWWHPSTFPLQEIIKDKKEDFILQNEEESVNYCQAKLDQLSTVLMESISAGTFSVPGGHKLYMEAKERIERDYWRVPRKGVKVRKKGSIGNLQNRVKGVSCQPESTAPVVGNKRKEAAEKEQEMLRQRLQEQQQQMEAQKKSLQENIDQLEKKLAWERENLLREQNMILEHKLKVSTAMASGVLDGHQCATPERFGCRSQQDVEGSIIALYCL
uniref:Guanylate binding protein family member 6 n=1 Tax=Equus asinus asinus TaxID=83772 RepID=A0A8C4MX08_EQUAS